MYRGAEWAHTAGPKDVLWKPLVKHPPFACRVGAWGKGPRPNKQGLMEFFGGVLFSFFWPRQGGAGSGNLESSIYIYIYIYV